MSWPGLPQNIASRSIAVNDLDMHILEAFPTSKENAPLIVLIHGFPELAYSWRKVIAPLAESGYHVVAPDLRGFGKTYQREKLQADPIGGKRVQFDDDLYPFRLLNVVTDIVALVQILGYSSVAMVVGHDYGSMVAANCALIRPDIFRSLVMMSAPIPAPPAFSHATLTNTRSIAQQVQVQLAALTPPRKHYMMYYSTAEANEEMNNPPQGLHSFFREYYHVKSADWKLNNPHPLSFTAAALGEMPHYYIMLLEENIPQSVVKYAPSQQEIASNTWLPDEELAVYVSLYKETGFQGGLNRYRCITDSKWTQDLGVFAGKQIEVPAMFISGKQDWGIYQYPGACDVMKEKTCKDMKDEDFVLIEGAGHWVQQEQPATVLEHLFRFLRRVA